MQAVLDDSLTAAIGSTKSYHGIITDKLWLNTTNYGYIGSWVMR